MRAGFTSRRPHGKCEHDILMRTQGTWAVESYESCVQSTFAYPTYILVNLWNRTAVSSGIVPCAHITTHRSARTKDDRRLSAIHSAARPTSRDECGSGHTLTQVYP